MDPLIGLWVGVVPLALNGDGTFQFGRAGFTSHHGSHWGTWQTHEGTIYFSSQLKYVSCTYTLIRTTLNLADCLFDGTYRKKVRCAQHVKRCYCLRRSGMLAPTGPLRIR